MHRTINRQVFRQHRTERSESCGTMRGVDDIKVVSTGDESPATPGQESNVPSVVVTVLKQVRCTFSGSYSDASNMNQDADAQRRSGGFFQ